MHTDETLSDAQIYAMWLKGLSWFGRIFRGVSYFVVALILIRMNSYGLPSSNYLALAIGLLGAGSASAKVAQLSIAALLLMAVVPLSVIDTIKAAMN